MAPRLPRLIAAALLALPPSVAAQTPTRAPDLPPAGQVITGETLRRAGATRLSEILAIAHRWDVTTVDGFTWSSSPLGGAPFLPARWTVMVDGRRMDEDLFGVGNLDRLGVSLDQVARVELIEVPRLVAGGLTTDGLIHIRTTEPSGGATGRGSFVTGSEIGDPGPFAFTPQATPNVDRMGHHASAEMGYGGADWFASAAVGWGRMVPTDPAIVERYIAALGSVPRMRSTAPALKVGGRFGGGRHEAVLRHSHLEGALGVSPFGTEIAADQRFTLIGLAGDMALQGGRRLQYDVSHARNRARRPGARPGPALDWRMATTEARAEIARRDATLQLAGLRLRRRSARAPNGLDDPTVALATAYFELRPGHGAGAVTASGAITVGEGDVGMAALLTRWVPVARGSALEAALSWERAAGGDDNTIWAWAERGYGLLEESGVSFDVLGTRRAPERIGADIGLTSDLGRSLSLSARAFLRRSRGLSLEQRELHFAVPTSSFDGPTAIVHGAGGEHAGAGVELAGRPARGVEVRASYWVRGAVGGDTVYRNAWAAVPHHGARGTMEYVPVPGLELWLSGAYRGPTRHHELTAVERESAGRYRERLDGAFTVDIALQKHLWNGRLRAHVGIRNLLGADLRYHPTGATFGPTAIVHLGATLP
jgi:hypothetical protein